MTPTQQKIEKLLRLKHGRHAQIELTTRDNMTPMRVALEHAERAVGACFDVWWIDNGLPAPSCLQVGDRTHLAFSTRHLEFMAQGRTLYGDSVLRLDEQARRQALRRLADHFLSMRNWPLSFRLFLASIENPSLLNLMGSDWRLLEYEPKNESYMAVWFFALLHELGHAKFDQIKDSMIGGAMSEMSLQTVIVQTINQYSYPEQIKSQLRRLASSSEASILHPKALREEVCADIFACVTLVSATVDVMEKTGRSFDFARMAYEILIVSHIRHLLDNTASFAALVQYGIDGAQAAQLNLAQRAATTVRNIFMTSCLEKNWVRMLGAQSQNPSRRVSDALNNMNKSIGAQSRTIDDAIAVAMRQCMAFKDEQELVRLPQWLVTVANMKDRTGLALLSQTINPFLSTARSFDCDHPILLQLDALMH